MNISPAPASGDPRAAAPPNWSLEEGCVPSGDDIYFFADVKQEGKVMARIGISGIATEAEARKLLASKARSWIYEFLSRARS